MDRKQGMTTKNRLLAFLKENRGVWVSGESVSNKIDVSRSAVWKQIRKLKAEGYVIDSSSKKGYRLLEVPDALIPNEIRDGLSTRVIGWEAIHHFVETDSTNILAKEYAEKGATEGTLVLAEAQTKGKGRKGRSWFSPSQGGIYLSLILRPSLTPAESPKITLLGAVAMADTLLPLTGLDIRIKWPNDLLVRGKKIAGILTEMSTETDRVHYIVLGVGLNVNMRHFPGPIQETATSLFVETGKSFSRIEILKGFLQNFETYYDLFMEKGFEPVLKRWKAMSDMIGRRIRVDMIDGTIIGTVQDVSEEGVLILKDEKGRPQRIFSGDITLL